MKNRIYEIRTSLNIKQEELADMIGTSQAQINRLEKGQRKLSQQWIEKISTALNVHPWDLIEETELKSKPMSKGTPIYGKVQAGIWHEAVQVQDDDLKHISIPTGDYGSNAFGLEVSGDSMNLEFDEGTVLGVVSVFDYNKDIKSGDFVIVERVNRDGLTECTVKQLEVVDGKAHLWARSTNPFYKDKPLDILWPYTGPEKHDIETVQIKGVVISATRVF